MKTETDIKPKSCVGCGFCCRKAVCMVGQRVFGARVQCPALVWDAEAKRYFCDLCRKPGDIGMRYRMELYVGEGCCCGLNSDRKNIPPPKSTEKNYPKEVQVLVKHMAGVFMSGDAIWMAIHGAAMELKDPDFEEYALRWIKEHRSTFDEKFMG